MPKPAPKGTSDEHILLQIRVPTTLADKLRRMAKSRGESLTALCRGVLRELVKN